MSFKVVKKTHKIRQAPKVINKVYHAPRVVINKITTNVFRMFQYFPQNISPKLINKNLQIDNSRVVMYFNYKQIQNKTKLEVASGNSNIIRVLACNFCDCEKVLHLFLIFAVFLQ